jgi:hypothetical protein
MAAHGALLFFDEHGEAYALVPPESFLLRPRRNQHQIEDEQIESFLRAWAPTAGHSYDNLLVEQLDQDEADRRVSLADGSHLGIDGHPWEIDLTALTFGRLLSGRLVLTELAARIRSRLIDDTSLATSLGGRELVVADTSTAANLARGPAADTVAERVYAAIAALPLPLPSNSVFQVIDTDGISVSLSPPTSSPDLELRVVCPQTHVTLTQAREALRNCVVDKDGKQRQAIVVCSADPGGNDVVLPLDRACHHLLREHGLGQDLATDHVRQAWLHETGSSEIIAVPIRFMPAPARSTRQLP